MAIREVLLLGNENLYINCKPIEKENLEKAKQVVDDLHDTMMAFRAKHGFGRAIAAPQIDEPYRIIYMNVDGNVTAFINPQMEFVGEEQFELWDDCMSFPGLEVKVLRYKSCRMHFKDLDWNDCTMDFEGDLSELIQHEYDHLDGILAVERALNMKAFRMKGSC